MSYNLIFLVVNFSSFCTMKNNRLKTEISSDIFLRNALTLVQDSESDSRSDRIQDSDSRIAIKYLQITKDSNFIV